MIRRLERPAPPACLSVLEQLSMGRAAALSLPRNTPPPQPWDNGVIRHRHTHKTIKLELISVGRRE